MNPAMKAALLLVCLAWTGSSRPQDAIAKPLTVRTSAGDHVIVELTVQDQAAPLVASACAVEVAIDGTYSQHILLTPGSGRATYDALLGPFQSGEHRIQISRSPLWTWPAEIQIARANTRIVGAESPDAAVIARAPTLGVRADTIGTASDLPLLVYAEDAREQGKRWIRYSAILSNEDGGTAPAALMARWGRTTDIELIYEIQLDGSNVVEERFQGPDHEMRAVKGEREGQHPYLLFATFNNMVIDRGKSLATIRPVPYVVAMNARTRESVMDDHPWIYRVMARELLSEKRVPAQVEDPREFLYVEANLTLENAVVSVQAGNGNAWSDSSRARYDLAVSRNGWVRIAVLAPPDASALRWNCQQTQGKSGSARCGVNWTRAFRLDKDYLPGPNLITAGEATFSAGFSEAIAMKR